MKKLLVVLASAAFLLSACGNPTVVPHTNKPGDNYCVYNIIEVKGAGGTMNVNDKICIFCTPDGPARCPTHNRSIEVDGVTYTLSNSGNICSSCPNKNTYQVK